MSRVWTSIGNVAGHHTYQMLMQTQYIAPVLLVELCCGPYAVGLVCLRGKVYFVLCYFSAPFYAVSGFVLLLVFYSIELFAFFCCI